MNILSRSLHYNISDADIRALFSPFGAIKKVDMSLDAATGEATFLITFGENRWELILLDDKILQ